MQVVWLIVCTNHLFWRSAEKSFFHHCAFETVWNLLKTRRTCRASSVKSPFPAVKLKTVITAIAHWVLKLLKNLKAAGPDSIPTFILQVAADELAPILTGILHLSLDTGVVPTDWKQTWVVPIFTKQEEHLAASYQSVSGTAITCKILEHIVRSSIWQILSMASDGNGLVRPNWHSPSTK